MKKILVIIALLAIICSLTIAQQRQTVEERATQQTERLDKTVGLTDEQKNKIQAVNLDIAKQTEEQFGKNRGNREAMQTALRKANAERDNKYKQILTDEQFKKYTEEKAKLEQELRNHRTQRRR